MSSSTKTRDYTVIHQRIPALAGVSLYQHPLTEFLYIKSGVLAVTTLSGRFIVPPKHGIIIPANVRHELTAKTDVELTAVHMDEPVIESNLTSSVVKFATPFFQAVMEEALSLPPASERQDKHQSVLAIICNYLHDLPHRDTFLPFPQDKRLIAITDKLQKHPALKSDLVSWAKFVNTSARTLTRNFKKETGLTYSQWRQRLNVQIAIKHLAQGDDISSIAELLGYESSSAFIYMFRQQVDISPKQFLKSLN